MDNTKYKSVAIPNHVHHTLKRIAHAEGRTIGGQMAHTISVYMKVADTNKVFDKAVQAK